VTDVERRHSSNLKRLNVKSATRRGCLNLMRYVGEGARGRGEREGERTPPNNIISPKHPTNQRPRKNRRKSKN
jgi:hypothetical protein